MCGVGHARDDGGGTCCGPGCRARAGPGQAVRAHRASIPGMDQSLRNFRETILSAQTLSISYQLYFLFTKVRGEGRITVISGNTDARVINLLCCVVANILHCNNDREEELLLSIG